MSKHGLPYEYSICRDIGVAAPVYPDMTFIVYHAGYEPRRTEGSYGPRSADASIDTLFKSLHDNGIAPDSNVFAELGSTWRMFMRDLDHAAHVLGKLIKFVGERNVLWGTDSIWYGSPQDPIQVFQAFQITAEYEERYRYPNLTLELCTRVFGLNSAKPYNVSPVDTKKQLASDRVQREKQAYEQDPEPSFSTNGPRTRREFLALQVLSGSPT